MYKTILVPIDLAHLDEGKATVDVAISITGDDAQIILLYVIEEIPNWTDIDLPKDFIANQIATAEEKLGAIAASSDRNIRVEVRTGHAYSTILKVAEADGADLIVLSSHRPGLKEYFIGSNTTKVVAHAQCSVHVVR